MDLTYRTRRRLKKAGIVLLIAALIATLLWCCWIVWVKRHIVYSRDGAILDFGLASQMGGEGELAVPPETGEPVSIYYNDGSELETLDVSMRQITGYYISAEMMANDMDTIRATIAALPVGSGVMLEVKSIRGTFHYSSNLEGVPLTSSVDNEAVDALIADIASRNLYLIASVPAFRDRNFGLENISCGLPFIGGGGALWLDESGCYWLDPTDSGSIDFLTRITRELEKLGFDEVVFTDFRFPESEQIDFSGDKVTAIQDAARQLVEECASDRFAVSFLASDSTVQSVGGRSRLYLSGVDAADAAATAGSYNVIDPAIDIVFLTDSYDTRYEAWSVLRPMDFAVTGS